MNQYCLMRSKKRTKGEGLSWHVEAEWGQATLDTVTGAEEEGSLATLIVKKKWLYSKFPDCTLEAWEPWDSFAFNKIHRRGCTLQLNIERVSGVGSLLCLVRSPQEWCAKKMGFKNKFGLLGFTTTARWIPVSCGVMFEALVPCRAVRCRAAPRQVHHAWTKTAQNRRCSDKMHLLVTLVLLYALNS